MTTQLEFFYDYASPFTYLASSQVPLLAQRTGAEVVYRPMVLGGVFQATGNAPPVGIAPKAANMSRDIQRWAKRYGVPFAMSPHFPVNTIAALRGALVTLREGGFDSYNDAVFRAIWVDGVNPADKGELAGVIDAAGLDGAGVIERTADPTIKDALRANTEEAVRRGAFGAPTFFVGDEMFFGNDRMDFVEEALA